MKATTYASYFAKSSDLRNRIDELSRQVSAVNTENAKLLKRAEAAEQRSSEMANKLTSEAFRIKVATPCYKSCPTFGAKY